jgi:hypothetical protein
LIVKVILAIIMGASAQHLFDFFCSFVRGGRMLVDMTSLMDAFPNHSLNEFRAEGFCQIQCGA